MVTSVAEYDAVAEDLEIALCRLYGRASVLSFHAAQRAGKNGPDVREVWWASIPTEAAIVVRAVTLVDLARRGSAAAWAARIKGELDHKVARDTRLGDI